LPFVQEFNQRQSLPVQVLLSIHISQGIMWVAELLDHWWSKCDSVSYIPQQALRNVASPDVANTTMHLQRAAVALTSA
jgi:hypothetical protein